MLRRRFPSPQILSTTFDPPYGGATFLEFSSVILLLQAHLACYNHLCFIAQSSFIFLAYFRLLRCSPMNPSIHNRCLFLATRLRARWPFNTMHVICHMISKRSPSCILSFPAKKACYSHSTHVHVHSRLIRQPLGVCQLHQYIEFTSKSILRFLTIRKE